MKRITISIVIATFNNHETIERCLDSIVAQDYAPLEVIVVNDGSTDNTAITLRDYRSKLNTRIINNAQNRGVSEARNIGMSYALADYILFVDADDYLIGSDVLTRLSIAASQTKADLVMFALDRSKKMRHRREHGYQTIHPGRSKQFVAFLSAAIINETINSPIKLYRRSLLVSSGLVFSKDYSIGEDLLFNLAFIKHCQTLCYAYGGYYFYATNNTSLTRKYDADRFRKLFALNQECELLTGPSYQSAWQIIRIKNALSCLRAQDSRHTSRRQDLISSVDHMRSAGGTSVVWRHGPKWATISFLYTLLPTKLLLALASAYNKLESLKKRKV